MTELSQGAQAKLQHLLRTATLCRPHQCPAVQVSLQLAALSWAVSRPVHLHQAGLVGGTRLEVLTRVRRLTAAAARTCSGQQRS
jgi:hypothetical protein